MARSSQSFSKNEKEKKRAKDKIEKAERMQDRKANQQKGKSLDDMMAYVDENGNVVSAPPDPSKKQEIALEDIQIGVPKYVEEAGDSAHGGTVSFFNTAKGFGFIRTPRGESVFMHINNILDPIGEGDKVTFEVENTPKGPSAVNVKKA